MKKLNMTAPVATFVYNSKWLPNKTKKVVLRQCVNRDTYQLLNSQDELPSNATKAQLDKAKKSREHGIKQMVQNCIVDDVNVDDLPMFVFEEMLLRIVSESNNNVRDLTANCKECGKQNIFSINLDGVEVKSDDDGIIDEVYKLNDEVSIKLKMPAISGGMPDNTWTATDFVLSCIDCIVNGDDVYYSNEYDLREFVDSMGLGDVTNIMQNWYAKQPHLHLDYTMKCKHCNAETVFAFRGIDDFF